MVVGKTDLTMRVNNTGEMATGSSSEYIANVAKMLFNMIPGTDSSTPNRGLNIQSKKFKTYTDGYRDTAYESEIVSQFTTYTDLIPVRVIVLYTNKRYLISMMVKYRTSLYNIVYDTAIDTLQALLDNNKTK